MAMNFQLLAAIPTDIRESIHTHLGAYNRTANSLFFDRCELPEHAALPLCVIAVGMSGGFLGGLIAETQFAWLRVSLMVVTREHRRNGIGSNLLKLAEGEAFRRKCSFAYVDTMDYQAPEFYERLGYALAGRLENWDSHGHAKLFFTKRLAQC